MLGLMLTRTHRRLLARAEADYNRRINNLIVSQVKNEKSLSGYYEVKLRNARKQHRTYQQEVDNLESQIQELITANDGLEDQISELKRRE